MLHQFPATRPGGRLLSRSFEHGPAHCRSHRHCRGRLSRGDRRARINRLHQPAIVGYILAGVLLGPSGLALIRRSEDVITLAELGVLMLLFLIAMGSAFGPSLRSSARPCYAPCCSLRSRLRSRSCSPIHELAGQDRGAARLHRIAEQHRRGDQNARGHRRASHPHRPHHGRCVDRPGPGGCPDVDRGRRDGWGGHFPYIVAIKVAASIALLAALICT